MTSRTVPHDDAPSPAAGPGDRPHLPPVQRVTSRRSDRKAPLGWLPWLLLGLLLLTLLVAALLTRVAGDDSGTGDAATPGSSAASSASGGGDAASAPGGGDAAALSAGGQDLLGLRGDGLSGLVGEPARGTATVQSVVADEGFWVGPDDTRRVFVFLTPQARRSAGESGFQVEAGQAVSLAGTVKASSPEFASSAGVTAAEGADELVQQGAYVEATEVRLAG